MPRDCTCTNASDRVVVASSHECCDRLSHPVRSSDQRDALREENLWLVQQLAIAEAHARHWQERVRALRHNVRDTEQRHAKERAHWQKQMTQKEREWTREYDTHMQSLLQIIAHHEETQTRMRADLDELKRHVETIERSTQTDCTPRVDAEMQCAFEGPVELVCLATQCHSSDGDQNHAVQTAELPAEVSADLIHEQYVAITMQKLLEQLRQSNMRTVSEPNPHSLPSAAELSLLTPESSFRDSIRKRLLSSSEPDTLSRSVPSSRTSAFPAIKSSRLRSASLKLPVLHEHETISGSCAALESPRLERVLYPSAA